jgi:hypothetical protein
MIVERDRHLLLLQDFPVHSVRTSFMTQETRNNTERQSFILHLA